jgi:hypothetical protein
MRRRRLLALCTAFILLALAGGAGAAPNPVKRPPSLLWNSYPLKQRTAASPNHPLRPPARAVGTGSSSGGGVGATPYLALLALASGATLVLTGLLGKSLIKDGVTMIAARRSAEPEPAANEDAKPDMLLALRPTAVSAEDGPALAESATKTPATRLAPLEDDGELEPEQSGVAPPVPPRPIRLVLRPLLRPFEEQHPKVEAPSAEQEAELPPLRAVREEQQRPEVEAPSAEEEEPAAEAQPAPAAEAATESQSESEPESKRLWRAAPPEVPKRLWHETSAKVPKRLWRAAPPQEDTKLGVESCQIRLWRGYLRYQLYAASGRDGVGRALALSPYFRLKDSETPGAAAKAALGELLDQLEAEGWTVVQERWSWYSFTLKRPL